MAESPAHKFGQIIGNVLQEAIEPLLQDFALRHGLYLDKKGTRTVRGGKKKVSWTDKFGNEHDLDFVLERGGSDARIGEPIAFIETAWRIYTKHARNKTQEIQGAVLPLVETYQNTAPFRGVVLAGSFTGGSLDQMKSQGFTVLDFPRDSVFKAFQRAGIDAAYDENTPDTKVLKKIRAWESLPKTKRTLVKDEMIRINSAQKERFMMALERTISRRIVLVRVLPLHGRPVEWKSTKEAIAFVERYDEENVTDSFARYEVEIRYNNGDRIQGHFADRHSAIEFLRRY
ncbi:MAG: hypothetical protein A2Z21_07155 [Candidatus Fraserbacteria bacterium RBG_16_55_9]|uniref:DNA methylase n=1 Tax=Fraserbacteria sp. (strain RBG_16_55_9) TaxID=1817864 RepID=A0A1F5USK7_FRAXR|nr:MAG: hypothetical protein A2Z21_07155 [Candidatus Fraserbacteria bacterium RBG_16_55_9]